MSTPKDYDSTVARIAGNIAAGLVGHKILQESWPPNADDVCELALYMATRIVKQCRQLQSDQKAFARAEGQEPVT